MKTFPTLPVLLVALLALAGGPAGPAGAQAHQEIPDTLVFAPAAADSVVLFDDPVPDYHYDRHRWMRTPIGDGLLTDRDQWREDGGAAGRIELHGEYNRVDRIRLGLGYQLQVDDPMAPRLGARVAYATGRNRVLYGFQIEQPLIPPGRIAFGASLVRRTDHSELHQVPDAENSLAVLLWRDDYRDYWEREGIGAYLAWRVPDFSNLSVHLRRDEYRSVLDDQGVRSLFRRSHSLRPNPPVDEGESHTASLRLEKSHRAGSHPHAGLYHWVEAERAGGGLGGDFTYTRLLGDVRGVLRLSPATTLLLRVVAGHTASGSLPAQKQFPLGGVDGLRAHPFAAFRGDQLALVQAEYVIGLWRLRTGAFEGGLHAIAFVDAGRAWSDPDGWGLGRQQLAVDGGVGVATAEDNLRVYFAKNLQRAGSDIVISVRLNRPF